MLVFALINSTAIEKANAMFDKFRLCVFSAVKGVVLDHGRPVTGAKVLRTYEWGWGGDREERDEAVTDESGRFQMPAIFRTSVSGALIPHEPHISQLLTIVANGKEYMAWSVMKRDYEENSEVDGKPTSIICRLENEVGRHGTIYGICEPDLTSNR